MKSPFTFLLTLAFFTLSGKIVAQTVFVDTATVKIKLENYMDVLEDTQKEWDIADILKKEQQQRFSEPGWLKLNFGLSRSNHWMRFKLKNISESPLSFYLQTSSAIIDTLYFYKIRKGHVLQVKINGEGIPFERREVRNRLLVFAVRIGPHETSEYYLKVIGNGQPLSMSATLLCEDVFHRQQANANLFFGIVYGSILLILLVNLSFYVMTLEKVYLFFFLQTVFSWLSTVYFDGFIREYLVKESVYWSNESVAIALCGAYIFALFFTIEFLNIRILAPNLIKFYYALAMALFGVLVVSFIHPAGFRLFVTLIILLTMAVVILMLTSVLFIRKKGYRPFQSAFWTVVSLIFFGTIYQLNMWGLIPDTTFTHHSIHMAVVSQAVLLTMGISIRFKYIKEDKEKAQQELLATMNEFSQTLIASIENERQRLASELHDSLGQSLLVIRNKLLLNTKKKDIPKEQKAYLLSLADTTSEALNEVRAISQNLRPAILDTFGLAASIRTLTAKVQTSTHLKVYLQVDDTVNYRIRKDLQINVYRIIQEAFSNVIKHANAAEIRIALTSEQEVVTLSISDNGTGFDPERKSEGLGLVGIRERVNLMQGTLAVKSANKEGTLLYITIPYSKKN